MDEIAAYGAGVQWLVEKRSSLTETEFRSLLSSNLDHLKDLTSRAQHVIERYLKFAKQLPAGAKGYSFVKTKIGAAYADVSSPTRPSLIISKVNWRELAEVTTFVFVDRDDQLTFPIFDSRSDSWSGSNVSLLKKDLNQELPKVINRLEATKNMLDSIFANATAVETAGKLNSPQAIQILEEKSNNLKEALAKGEKYKALDFESRCKVSGQQTERAAPGSAVR